MDRVAEVIVAPNGMPDCALTEGVVVKNPTPSSRTIRPFMMVKDVFFIMQSLPYLRQCYKANH
jgi:hypothetical protein